MGNSCCGDQRSMPTKSSASAANRARLAYFDALPPGVQEATVESVYDGDTLTIRERGRARVRLLGIDTPELKEREPYAKEAAAYTRQLCAPNTRVWLQTPRGGDGTDRYGRTLAFVFVADVSRGSGYICVNIAILEEGLGSFYAPAGSTTTYRDELLQAQQRALRERRNVWSSVNVRAQVVCTRNGIAFHRPDCKLIARSNPRNLRRLSAEKALEEGHSSCRECKPLM
ncbi:Staphylococcal nuclease-like protein [Novymonas esmeraldas]|uniref:Staphylococcal nuclease-like protein n=1 Tax=Novymonas esmeraldas TaxID=1808958 RepID=A0AAW0F861_9TRYP